MPLRHDRPLSEASNFQIGEFRGRLSSNGMLVFVSHRWHFTPRSYSRRPGFERLSEKAAQATIAFHAQGPSVSLRPTGLTDGLDSPFAGRLQRDAAAR